jgi:hypothetical protein
MLESPEEYETNDRIEAVRAWLDSRVPATSTFILRRDEDPTGVSGTGVVADGCIFPPAAGGGVAMRWRGEVNSVNIHKDLRDVRRIHGHDGATRVEIVPYWVLADMVEATLTALEELLCEAPVHVDSYAVEFARLLAKTFHEILTQDAPIDDPGKR